MKRPRILYLTPTPVDDRSFGGAIRSNDLRRALGEVGEVGTLVLQGGPVFGIDPAWQPGRVRTLTYTARGPSWRGWRDLVRVRRCIAALIEEHRPDVIVARYAGQAGFVPRQAWSRLIVDPDDVYKSLGPEQGGRLARWRMGLRNLLVARMLRRARHVWLVNPRDQGRLGLARSSLLGNVVPVPPRRPLADAAVPGRILMVGFFPHPPNAQGLRFFAREVLPELRRRVPGVELHAIGKCPPDLAAELAGEVAVRGYVDDLATEYARAALVVAPIFSGAGTQIKVIDALAHARPLVASGFACEGFAFALHDRQHLRVAGDAPADWVTVCAEVLADPARENMATRGHDCVAECFGPDSMLRAVRQTLDNFLPG